MLSNEFCMLKNDVALAASRSLNDCNMYNREHWVCS